MRIVGCNSCCIKNNISWLVGCLASRLVGRSFGRSVRNEFHKIVFFEVYDYAWLCMIRTMLTMCDVYAVWCITCIMHMMHDAYNAQRHFDFFLTLCLLLSWTCIDFLLLLRHNFYIKDRSSSISWVKLLLCYSQIKLVIMMIEIMIGNRGLGLGIGIEDLD